MALPTTLKQAHVMRQRQAVTSLVSAIEQLRSCSQEWVALDIGNNLTPEDFEGAGGLDGLTVEAVAAVYVTLAALEQLLAAGHATNLYRVRAG